MKKIISFALAIIILMSCTSTVAFAVPKTNQDTVRYTVLILDSSGSMKGNPHSAQITAAERFCDSLLSAAGKNYVAIVRINTSSSKVCDFTDDVSSLKTAIKNVGANGGTNINGALGIADTLLSSVPNDTNVIKNIILCSDGLPESGSQSYNGPYYYSDSSDNYSYANKAYSTASSIKNSGIFIYTLGFFHSLYGKDLTFGRKLMNDLQNAGYYEVIDPNELEFKFGEIADDVVNSVKEISFTYQSGHDYTAKCYYTNDYFASDSYTYNQHLATMSISFAMSAFGSEDGGDKDYSNKSKNARQLLQEIGMDSQKIETNSWFTKKPTSDSIAVIAGNMPIKTNGEDYTLIAVAIRGGGYEQEWASNFTIGNNGNHNGFDTAKSNVLDFLHQYMINQKITGNVKLWITGYSRAAATANLVSGELHNNNELSKQITLKAEDIYTYCFETPAGLISSNYSNSSLYSNIFNIINLNDLVPYVAPSALGFRRYGIDKYTPTAETSPKDYSTLLSKMKSIYYSLDSTTDYIVDDFQMKKLTLNVGFNGVSFVEDDKNNNYSQGTFLSKYISILSLDYIKDRNNYVNNYQNVIREILSVFFGCSDAQREVLLNSICEQAKKHWGDFAKSYIWNAGINPFGSEYDSFEIVIGWLKTALSEAGITNYNEAEIDSAGKKLCDLFLSLIATHPNYFTTAICNISGIGAAHYPELCYSWMASMDSYYDENSQEQFSNGGYRIIRINCAVDVTVTDANGSIVASITNDSPDKIANSNYIYGVDSDKQKYVVLPIDDSYTIKISGREDDTVDYGVLEYSAFAGNFTRNVNFFDVNLSKDDYLIGTVSPYSDSEIEADNGDGSTAIYKLSTSDGTNIAANSDISGDNVLSKTYSITVTSSNPEYGMVSGTGTRYYGEYAEITATPAEGYEFVGWYENESQISKDLIYRFRVEKDRNLIAKFEPSEKSNSSKKTKPSNKNNSINNKSSTIKKDTSKTSPKTECNNNPFLSIIATFSLMGFIVFAIIAKKKSFFSKKM